MVDFCVVGDWVTDDEWMNPSLMERRRLSAPRGRSLWPRPIQGRHGVRGGGSPLWERPRAAGHLTAAGCRCSDWTSHLAVGEFWRGVRSNWTPWSHFQCLTSGRLPLLCCSSSSAQWTSQGRPWLRWRGRPSWCSWRPSRGCQLSRTSPATHLRGV